MASNNVKIASNSGTTVAALITAMSSKGRIEVTDDETISADLTVPESVELVPAGGVLTIAENATLIIEGKVSGQPGGLITFEDGFDTSGPDTSNYPTLKIYGPTVPGARIVKQLRTSYVNRAVVEIHNHPVCPTVFGVETGSATGLNSDGESNVDCWNDCLIAACAYGGDGRYGASVRIPSGITYFDKPWATADLYFPGVGNAVGSERDHKITGNGKRKSILRVIANGFDYVGDWANSTSYSKGDIVRASDGNAYFCLVAGDSSGDDSDLAGADADTVGSDGLQWTLFNAWFDFDDISNGVLRDFGIDGYKSQQSGTQPTFEHTNSAGDTTEIALPLVKFSSYLFSLDNIDVRYAKGCGVLFLSSQSYSIRQLSSTRHGSWGVIVRGATALNFMDLDSENHDTNGGVLIHQLDGGQRDRILGTTFTGHLYTEGTNPGIRIEDASGIKQTGRLFHSTAAGTGKCIELGPGARDCSLDMRSCETDAECEAGSFNNEIIFHSGGAYGRPVDLGSNALLPVGGHDAYRWDAAEGVSGDELFASTNPAVLYATETATLINQSGYSPLIHPVAAYDGSGLIFKRLQPSSVSVTYVTTLTGLSVATRYFYMLSMVNVSTTVEVRFRNNDGSIYLNPITGAYDSDTATGFPVPHIPGKTRWTRLPFTYPSGTPNVQIQVVVYNYSSGAYLDMYHVSCSTESSKRVEYKRGGNTYGFGDKPQFAFASLPAASLFDDGTRIWDTTNKRYVYSDGTDWLDSAGDVAS